MHIPSHLILFLPFVRTKLSWVGSLWLCIWVSATTAPAFDNIPSRNAYPFLPSSLPPALHLKQAAARLESATQSKEKKQVQRQDRSAAKNQRSNYSVGNKVTVKTPERPIRSSKNRSTHRWIKTRWDKQLPHSIRSWTNVEYLRLILFLSVPPLVHC